MILNISKGGTCYIMSNSSLISYTKISPNKTSPRNHKIDTITIHCMAGNLSVETCGNVFAPTTRKASSNYGIGSDGRIALYVDEKDRSWCTGNKANDHRAITIEVANDGGAPDWHVSDKALKSLIDLCSDICKRNGIKELKWKGDKSLIGQIDKQNMTVHRWFQNKACIPSTSDVLTRNGWKKIDDVVVGEEIACAHIDDLKISFEKIYDKVDLREQDTYTCNGFTATKDHRMIYKNQTNNIYKINEYKKILGDTHAYVPLAGHSQNKGIDISNDMIKFIVAVQADGSYMYEYNKMGEKKFYGLEFHLKKERKINRVKELLAALYLKFSENQKKDGSTSIRVYNQSDKNIVEDICEKYLCNKKFSWSLLNMSLHQVSVFIEELMKWDGSYTTNKSYFSKEVQNLDVVQAIAAINGIGVKVSGNVVLFRDSPFITMSGEIIRNQKRIKQNKDLTTVTCVSVPTGIFLCRQNGKTFIIGNCPGNYLYNLHGQIAKEVNAKLGIKSSTDFVSVSIPSANIILSPMTITKGNPQQFSQIIKNIKTALNTDYGLKFVINNTIDDILLANLENVLLSTASYKKNITYALQQLLKWWGFDIAIDGIYGNGTKTIIQQFQALLNLSSTGTTTKNVWYKLLGK